ncbi:MAG: DUF3987 domain-containing protein [Proteobacteria bacterium]|nr:DUF3987 domain-containing protein [Pseudomonadota bacterium]
MVLIKWVCPKFSRTLRTHSYINPTKQNFLDPPLGSLWDDLTGVLSKSKGQILRVAAVLNALFSMDCDHPLDKQLSSASVEAAINFVEICNEHTAVIGGRNNTSDPIVSTCKLFSYVSINLVAVEN